MTVLVLGDWKRVGCPYCGVEPKEPCVSLAGRFRCGPHAARLAAARR